MAKFIVGMSALNLIRGIFLIKQKLTIEGKHNIEVIAIEFEDGGGKKFNYRITGKKEWHFIDLSDEM